MVCFAALGDLLDEEIHASYMGMYIFSYIYYKPIENRHQNRIYTKLKVNTPIGKKQFFNEKVESIRSEKHLPNKILY